MKSLMATYKRSVLAQHQKDVEMMIKRGRDIKEGSVQFAEAMESLGQYERDEQ